MQQIFNQAAFVLALLLMVARTSQAETASVLVSSVERVRTGFQFTEGPAWDGKGTLYFSDVPAGIIYNVSGEGKPSVFVEPSHHSNGILLWGDFLYACEMDSAVVRYRVGQAGSREVLASEYAGARFNAPNDLVVDHAGGVYFTDPEFRAPKPWPQKTRSVYYLDPAGKVTRVVEDLPNPNGVILSPDEKTLYVIPSSQAAIVKYAVTAPGKLGPAEEFASMKQPVGSTNSGGDGCTIDAEGWLYVATGLGIQVFSPDGKLAEVIAVPEVPSNVTFGGPEYKTLFMTARTSVYKAETSRKGHLFGPK